MTYSLPVTSLLYNQVEKIQKRAQCASLGKMGYNQNFPLAVVYGPKSVGPLDLVDLTMEQGIRAVASFLYHKFATDGVSRLMDISLCYSQMEAAWAEPLVQRPDITIPYLTSTWLTNMRDFMENHNFQIETSNEWSMRPQCENDTMLMKYFASRGVSKYNLRHLNACQMFLQVLSIEDIATANGVQIHQNSLDCKHITTRQSPLRWPNQPEPTLHLKQDWKDCLTRYLLTSG